MSYQLYSDDECVSCQEYVKEIINNEKWNCIICHMTESSTIPISWLRYQLSCSHQTHIQEMVGCPTCGLLKMKEEHMYCVYCNKFGHKSTSCLY